MAQDGASARPLPVQDGRDSLSLPSKKLAVQNLPVPPGSPAGRRDAAGSRSVSSTDGQSGFGSWPHPALFPPVPGPPQPEPAPHPDPCGKLAQDKPLPGIRVLLTRTGWVRHVKQGQLDEAQATFKELAK